MVPQFKYELWSSKPLVAKHKHLVPSLITPVQHVVMKLQQLHSLREPSNQGEWCNWLVVPQFNFDFWSSKSFYEVIEAKHTQNP